MRKVSTSCALWRILHSAFALSPVRATVAQAMRVLSMPCHNCYARLVFYDAGRVASVVGLCLPPCAPAYFVCSVPLDKWKPVYYCRKQYDRRLCTLWVSPLCTRRFSLPLSYCCGHNGHASLCANAPRSRGQGGQQVARPSDAACVSAVRPHFIP